MRRWSVGKRKGRGMRMRVRGRKEEEGREGRQSGRK